MKITIELDEGGEKVAKTWTSDKMGRVFEGARHQQPEPLSPARPSGRPLDSILGGMFGGEARSGEDQARVECLRLLQDRGAPSWRTLLTLHQVLGPAAGAADVGYNAELDALAGQWRSGEIADPAELQARAIVASVSRSKTIELADVIEYLSDLQEVENDVVLEAAGEASNAAPSSIFDPQTTREAEDWAERDRREAGNETSPSASKSQKLASPSDVTPEDVHDLLRLALLETPTLDECKARTQAELRAAASFAQALRTATLDDDLICPVWLRKSAPKIGGCELVGDEVQKLGLGTDVRLRRPIWSYPLQRMKPTGSILRVASFYAGEDAEDDELDFNRVDLVDPQRPELGAVITGVHRKFLAPAKG